jgi:transcriptional regulator with XRE-family HTH domain
MSNNQETRSLFGAAVRRIRLKKAISQERLAEVADLDRSYVGAVERGERNPSLIVIKKIAVALGVKLSTLFSECEAKASPGSKPSNQRVRRA